MSATLDNFDWRISIADIEQDGPFSPFPGVERSIMLLDGDGVVLNGPGISHQLKNFYHPFHFPGDAILSARLLGGRSRDFNVMVRRERYRFEVQVLTAPAQLNPMHCRLLLAVGGTWNVNNRLLLQDQILWWAEESLGVDLAPRHAAARLIAVTLIER